MPRSRGFVFQHCAANSCAVAEKTLCWERPSSLLCPQTRETKAILLGPRASPGYTWEPSCLVSPSRDLLLGRGGNSGSQWAQMAQGTQVWWYKAFLWLNRQHHHLIKKNSAVVSQECIWQFTNKRNKSSGSWQPRNMLQDVQVHWLRCRDQAWGKAKFSDTGRCWILLLMHAGFIDFFFGAYT